MSQANQETALSNTGHVIRHVMTEMAIEQGISEVIVDGETLAPSAAFVEREGLDSLSGYSAMVYEEMFGQPMPNEIPFSIAVMIIADGVFHAKRHYMENGAINLDAMKAAFGHAPAPTLTRVYS